MNDLCNKCCIEVLERVNIFLERLEGLFQNLIYLLLQHKNLIFYCLSAFVGVIEPLKLNFEAVLFNVHLFIVEVFRVVDGQLVDKLINQIAVAFGELKHVLLVAHCIVEEVNIHLELVVLDWVVSHLLLGDNLRLFRSEPTVEVLDSLKWLKSE